MARHSQYPQQKVDEALLAYYTLGTYEKASTETGVPASTIHEWATNTHKDRYHELRGRLGAELEDEALDHWRRVTVKAALATDQAIDATTEAIAQGNAKDAQALSTAARNTATVGGIYADKTLVFTGRPDRIVGERRDLDDILKSLNTLVPGLVINGTAEEIRPEPKELAA